MLDETQEEMYIDLPSNVKTYNSTLQNKPNHYKTVLPRALEFANPSQWEVALVGINFAQTFNTTVTVGNCSFTFQERRSNDNFLEWLKSKKSETKYQIGRNAAQASLKSNKRRLNLLTYVLLRFER
jgi:hypothetical protein